MYRPRYKTRKHRVRTRSPQRRQGHGNAEIVKLLELVGIPDPERRIKDYPFQLSGGMQHRVMIAMALSCSPELASVPRLNSPRNVAPRATEGLPPNLAQLPHGARSPALLVRLDQCHQEEPQLKPVSEGHYRSCFYDEQAGEGDGMSKGSNVEHPRKRSSTTPLPPGCCAAPWATSRRLSRSIARFTTQVRNSGGTAVLVRRSSP